MEDKSKMEEEKKEEAMMEEQMAEKETRFEQPLPGKRRPFPDGVGAAEKKSGGIGEEIKEMDDKIKEEQDPVGPKII